MKQTPIAKLLAVLRPQWLLGACLLIAFSACGPMVADRFVAAPYLRPSDRYADDTLFVTIDPAIRALTLLNPAAGSLSHRYTDFRGSVSASISKMFDDQFAAVQFGVAPGAGDYHLQIHRFDPSIAVVSIAGSDAGTNALYGIAIDYDAELSRGSEHLNDASGRAESSVRFTRRDGFMPSSRDAVQRALESLWKEASSRTN